MDAQLTYYRTQCTSRAFGGTGSRGGSASKHEWMHNCRIHKMHDFHVHSYTLRNRACHAASGVCRVSESVLYFLLHGIACIFSHPTLSCEQVCVVCGVGCRKGIVLSTACITYFFSHPTLSCEQVCVVCGVGNQKSVVFSSAVHRMYLLTPYTLAQTGVCSV